jgi:hypothetical protein
VQGEFSDLRPSFELLSKLPQDHAPYSLSFRGRPVAWTQTPADLGIRAEDCIRLDVIGLPPDLKSLDASAVAELREAAEKQAAERKAAELKKAEEARIAWRTRPRPVFRVVRRGTSTTGTPMYLLRLDGAENRWATADNCSPALKEVLLAGKRDGFTEQHTVSLPVEPLKERRKSKRCRDARSTDYAVRVADAARVRKASKNKSEDDCSG